MSAGAQYDTPAELDQDIAEGPPAGDHTGIPVHEIGIALTRSMPNQLAQSAELTVPSLNIAHMLLGESLQRQVVRITTTVDSVVIASSQTDAANGHGPLIAPGNPAFEITSTGPIWVMQPAGAVPAVVGSWAEYRQG